MLKENTAIVEQVVIAYNADNPYGNQCDGKKKILQVFDMKGNLIAVDPERLIEALDEREQGQLAMYKESEELKKRIKELDQKLYETVKMKDDIIDKSIKAMFSMLAPAKRALRNSRYPSNKEKQSLIDAEKFFDTLNNPTSHYHK